MAQKTAADARKALDTIRPLLAQMERGAGFCEDRGFGWSVASEDREGRPLIAQLIATHPQLADVLPDLVRCLAENRPFADVSWKGPLHVADQALAAMAAKASFNRKPGRPLAQRAFLAPVTRRISPTAPETVSRGRYRG